ncbi:MAG: hypothetical protein JKY45_10905 [Emcibacter sp.]|nr:hypothetical protein [Emcibacter sp.]
MPASEQDLLDCFRKLGIKTTTVRHPPLHSVTESRHLRGEIAGGHCKSLFLKDKKGQYLLVILEEDRTLDMVGLFKSGKLPIKRLSFANAETMKNMLGITPGSVTPFCLINQVSEKLLVVLDKKMMENNLLNYHPLHNEATTTISAPDLIKFITYFGFEPHVMDFDNL